VGGALFTSSGAFAADPPPWTGLYVGGSAGFLTGATRFSNPYGVDIYGGDVPAAGLAAGIQLGYNWLILQQWLLGLEAAGNLTSSAGSNTCLQSSARHQR
jgi:hypothetical protein